MTVTTETIKASRSVRAQLQQHQREITIARGVTPERPNPGLDAIRNVMHAWHQPVLWAYVESAAADLKVPLGDLHIDSPKEQLVPFALELTRRDTANDIVRKLRKVRDRIEAERATKPQHDAPEDLDRGEEIETTERFA